MGKHLFTYYIMIMVFIFRMPPYYSKPYPITRILCPTSSKNKPLQFGEASALKFYQRQSVHDDLKKVVRHVKEPLKLFPKIIHAEFSVTIESDKGIQELHWEMTIKEAHKSLHCVLDALAVLHQGLFHSKIVLKHVEQILDEDNRNDAGINKEITQKLRELKDNLQNLNNFLDRVLLHYSGFNSKLSPTLIKDIKHTTKKIYEILSNPELNRLEKLIPKGMVTEEDVLCSVLGLHDDFAKRLKHLSKEMRQHKTDMYYLMCFMRECDESDNVVNLRDTKAVKCGLQKMGFIENRSNVIAKWIAEQPFPEHRSLLAWAQIYLENLFKYDIFLNDQVCKFPFEERCLNKWFLQNVDGCEDEDGDVAKVRVINANSKEKAITSIESEVAKFKETDPKGQFYFHGTDHESAVNILQYGINLGEGTSACDFSNGWGFYATDSFQYALEESAMTSKFAALIMFNISDDCLKEGLDLSGPAKEEDLKSVIEYFRAGEPRKHGLDQKLYKDIKSCHYIIGPVRRDGTDGIKSRKCENVLQICIRDEEMSDEIGSLSRIAGIIFLNVEDTQLARR